MLEQGAIDAMPPLSKVLIIYGPLGVLALIACLVCIKLYRDGRTDRAAAAEQLEAQRQEFTAQLDKERAEREEEREQATEEMQKLEERYIAKTETQLEKYHELAKALNQVLDSAFKRRGE